MATNKKERKIEIPKIKFFWRKYPKEGKLQRPISSAQVLINGKLIVFIFCSLVSAFINLVFISNLTKSDYNIGTLIAVPAAVLLGLLSVGLDIGKFLLAIQVNTLGELIRKLSKFTWVKRVKRAAIWWRTVYVTFIMLSVITSVSLSTISIGAGISRNANLIKQIDEYVVEGEQYTGINKAAKNANFQSVITDATSTKESDARGYAIEKTDEVNSFIDKIRPIVTAEYIDDDGENGKTAAQKKKEALDPYEAERSKINNILRNAGYRARTFEELVAFDTSNLQSDLKKKQLEFLSDNSNKEATEKLNQLTVDTDVEVRAWLETLNALNLVNPKTGEVLEFSTDENKTATVLAKSALTILKALRVDVENDSGDIGSSSKLFMQLGGAWDAKHVGDKDLQAALNVKTEGSFGSTEVMMMGMLLFLSLLCELLINLFSPKTNISRKMLSQFSEYFDSDFDVNDFMLDIYLDQLNFGILDRDAFDRKSKKAVELTEITKASLYEKYRKNGTKRLQNTENKKQYNKVTTESTEEPQVAKLVVTNPEAVKESTISEPVKQNVPVREIAKAPERIVSTEIVQPKVEDVKETEETVYSSAVSDLINDIEGIE